MEFSVWFGNIANTITIVAGVIAIATVVVAWLNQPKLSVRTHVQSGPIPQLQLTFSSVGASSIRDIELSIGVLDDNDHAACGDGAGAKATLGRNESLTIRTQPADVQSSTSAPEERVFNLKPTQGIYVTAQFRAPVLTWLRASRTFAWPPVLRAASEHPVELRGHRERSFLDRVAPQAHQAPNRHRPSNAAKRWIKNQPLPTASVATDSNFDNLVSHHSGPAFIGLGPTWQGEWWDNTKHALDSLAARHAPRVLVLTVDVDNNPVLQARFPSSTLPYFVMYQDRQITQMEAGFSSIPELEELFRNYLK
ncbi:thioredoxin family protein [Microbacterium testaceum]|uniref:thioredoxin family protein n=1 Tax=Microbacterium testaceum TaxID=2033 RepID=UPI00128F4DDE|nr:thioredoxin family protein [Microbacterium testaceum]